jgi:hypothetical protein
LALSKAGPYALKGLTIVFFILAAFTLVFVNITAAFLFSIPGLLCALTYRSAVKRYNRKLMQLQERGRSKMEQEKQKITSKKSWSLSL